MSAFDFAIGLVLQNEGGYVNHPSDPGGETKYGITKRQYPELDIANLTVEQAKGIYKRDYWDAISGDRLPPQIATLVFDCAVNQGPKRAIKFMQTALGTSADGVIGPRTLHAAYVADPAAFATRMNAERALHYASLSTFDVFGKGWMRRLFDVTIKVFRGY
jgi:lysozyme family protein